MMTKLSMIAALVCFVLLVLAPAASANPSEQQYKNPMKQESPPTNPTTGGPSTAKPASGALPFTGLDLTLVLIGGGGALAGGLVLRRVGRRGSA